MKIKVKSRPYDICDDCPHTEELDDMQNVYNMLLTLQGHYNMLYKYSMDTYSLEDDPLTVLSDITCGLELGLDKLNDLVRKVEVYI